MMKTTQKKTVEVSSPLERYSQALIVGGIVLLYIFVPFFVVKPMFDSIVETNSQIDQNQQVLSTMKTKETTLRSFQQSDANQANSKLSEAIQQSIDLPLILATMQKLASDSQLTLGTFSLSSNTATVAIVPIKDGNILSSFEFNVGLNGPLDNIQNFYTKLATYSPLLTATSLQYADNKATLGFKYYFQLKTAGVNISPTPVPSEAPTNSDETPVPVVSPLPAIGPKELEAISKVKALTPPVLSDIQISTQSAVSKSNPFQ